MSATSSGRGRGNHTRGIRGGRGRGGRAPGNNDNLPNYADGYSDGFSVHTVEAITVVDLDEPQLRNMEHMFHLYAEAVDNAEELLALHTQVVQLRQYSG
jgi:hypothetical protein